MNENVFNVVNLPCYPDELPDLEANDIVTEGMDICSGCEHMVESYAVKEGCHTIGYAMKCDKGVWKDDI